MSIEEKVLSVLKVGTLKTIDIAKAVGLQTKAQINSTLYALEKKGDIVKVTAQPPSWRLTELPTKKERVLLLTESAPIKLVDVIGLLESETLSDIVYYTTHADELVTGDGVTYSFFERKYDCDYVCNIIRLTSDPNIQVYLCYNQDNKDTTELLSTRLMRSSGIKVILSLEELN